LIGYETFENADWARLCPATGHITYKPYGEQKDSFLWDLRDEFLPGIEDRVLFAHLAIHLARILPYRFKKQTPQKWIYFAEFVKCLEGALA
jgi:hypothetical protein